VPELDPRLPFCGADQGVVVSHRKLRLDHASGGKGFSQGPHGFILAIALRRLIGRFGVLESCLVGKSADRLEVTANYPVFSGLCKFVVVAREGLEPSTSRL
jgi:hypothetical protein